MQLRGSLIEPAIMLISADMYVLLAWNIIIICLWSGYFLLSGTIFSIESRGYDTIDQSVKIMDINVHKIH